jgi:hypothetical protein
MGVPTSEVGYTSATTRRETTKSMTDMWYNDSAVKWAIAFGIPAVRYFFSSPCPN